MLTPEQFDRTRQLALRLAGIELFDRHREVLARKIRRLGIHDAAGFNTLLMAADAGDARAGQQLIGLLTTTFSGFFRNPSQFDQAAEHALWAVHRRGATRLWSVAAAMGEEPYSLAMALIDIFQSNDPPATILATDINEAALAVALRGEYGEASLGALTPEQRTQFFSAAAGPARWQVVSTVQQLVSFHALNLVDPAWPIDGQFDVIFCRNVLMYLKSSHRGSVLERIATLLAPDGLLILDPVEDPGAAGHLFTPGKNGIFFLRSKSANGTTNNRSHTNPFKGQSS
jgi:chemotaxis protein methyltransferase CheR